MQDSQSTPNIPEFGKDAHHSTAVANPNAILLEGCTPSPLAAYLKALGILRLVAIQVDNCAKGYWKDEYFVLLTKLHKEELLDFFLKDYQPTPLLSPWNGGSGFYKKGNETAWQTLNKFKTGNCSRWNLIFQAVEQMSEQIQQLGLKEKPGETEKKGLISRLRANLDDQFLIWLDASVVLSGHNPKYPPLLGTGGNDGGLDFTSNYLQRLSELFDIDSGNPHTETLQQLKSSLFATAIPGLTERAIGQFSPGNAGGPNASSGFEGDSLVNPWDYILMLEGAVLFATNISKRMQSESRGAPSFPFTVGSCSSGTGAAAFGDESSTRAEIWMPLWQKPIGLNELRTLLEKGRVSLGRSPARDGLEFVRAVSKLSVDRGISLFQRYAFVQRSGKAYLAIPVSRLRVNRNPSADIIDELDRSDWLQRFRNQARSQNAPGKLKMLARRLEDSLFELTRKVNPGNVQSVLRILGTAQVYLSTSPSLMESVPPVPGLSKEWSILSDDASHEHRIAQGLAGIYERNMPMRAYLEENLFFVLKRRLQESETKGPNDKPISGWPPADLAAVSAFMSGLTDNNLISELLSGLTLVKPPSDPLPPRDVEQAIHIPAAFCLLKPIFSPNRQLKKAGLIPEHKDLPLPMAIPRLLHAGHTDKALKTGIRLLRTAGFSVPWRQVDTNSIYGPGLLAALMVPLSTKDVHFLVKRACMRIQ